MINEAFTLLWYAKCVHVTIPLHTYKVPHAIPVVKAFRCRFLVSYYPAQYCACSKVALHKIEAGSKQSNFLQKENNQSVDWVDENDSTYNYLPAWMLVFILAAVATTIAQTCTYQICLHAFAPSSTCSFTPASDEFVASILRLRKGCPVWWPWTAIPSLKDLEALVASELSDSIGSPLEILLSWHAVRVVLV